MTHEGFQPRSGSGAPDSKARVPTTAIRPVVRTAIRRGLLFVGAALCVGTSAGAQVVAQTLPLSETQTDSALAIALRQVAGERLSLEEAVSAGLAQSTDVRAAEAAFAAARGSLRRERGLFDPALFAELEKSSTEIPSASPFAGAEILEQEDTRARGGARVRLPIGTEIEAAVTTHSLGSNSAFASLDPERSATSSLSLRQPLLKGFGPGASGEKNAVAREADAASARFEDARAALRAEVESTYWSLYAAERDLAAQIVIQDRARLLREETQLRASAGLVARGAVANSEAFLAESDQALLDREEAVDAISDRLATLMGRRPVEATGRFHATDAPPTDVPDLTEDQVIERAKSRNRELQAAREDVAAARARARAAGWNALPQLDLIGSIGGNGLSGDPRDVVFGGDTLRVSSTGGMGDAVSDAIARDFPSWSAGVQITLPIGLREGRGERDRLRAELALAEQRELAVERQIEENTRRSWRELSNSTRRLDAAERGVAASLEQVRLAIIEYRNGTTTAFEVVTLAADLALAQQRYSGALVRAAQAWAEIRRLTHEEAP